MYIDEGLHNLRRSWVFRDHCMAILDDNGCRNNHLQSLAELSHRYIELGNSFRDSPTSHPHSLAPNQRIQPVDNLIMRLFVCLLLALHFFLPSLFPAD